jgi:hypothetical protein
VGPPALALWLTMTAWALVAVGGATEALVRKTADACGRSRDEPAQIGGLLAGLALVAGLTATIAASIGLLRRFRRAWPPQHRGLVLVAAIVQLPVAAYLCVAYLSSMFTLCF